MYLPASPAGRPIVDLQGDAATIRRRGSEILSMGSRMISSADFLESLADEASGQRGEAVEKLREVIGDTYEELRRAGNMYKPTGPVLKTYADALDESKPRVNRAVDSCQTWWDLYQQAPGYLEGQRPTWGAPEEGSEEAEANASADATKQRRYDTFIEKAQLFDAEMDTWEEAFDAAVTGIGEILDGSIEDGFWDDVDGFVAGALVVLQWAGTILAVAAIIIGGPIIAALSAVVAVATLALTIYQSIRGDASGWDLAFAIIGVIPFGSMGKLFQGKQGLIGFAGDAFPAFKPSTWSAAGAQLDQIMMAGRFAEGGLQGLLQGGRTFWQLNNPNGVGDMLSRFVFGKDVSGMDDLMEAVSGATRGWDPSTTLPAAWEFTHSMVGAVVTNTDRLLDWTGNDDAMLTEQLPWLGAVL